MLLCLGLFPIAVWYIFLTVSNPICETWVDILEYVLSEESQLTHLFYTSVIFGLLSIAAAIAYFSKVSNSKIILLTLLVFCLTQAITAIVFIPIDTSFVYLLSVLTGYLAYKNPNKALKAGREKASRPLA